MRTYRYKKKFIRKLEDAYACEEALRWANKHPSLQAAWDKCTRDDWMHWLVEESSTLPWPPRLALLNLQMARKAVETVKYERIRAMLVTALDMAEYTLHYRTERNLELLRVVCAEMGQYWRAEGHNLDARVVHDIPYTVMSVVRIILDKSYWGASLYVHAHVSSETMCKWIREVLPKVPNIY